MLFPTLWKPILPVKRHQLVLQLFSASLKPWKDTSYLWNFKWTMCSYVHTIWPRQTLCVMIICWFKTFFQLSMTGCISVNTTGHLFMESSRWENVVVSLKACHIHGRKYIWPTNGPNDNMKNNTAAILPITHLSFQRTHNTYSVVEVIVIKCEGLSKAIFKHSHI